MTAEEKRLAQLWRIIQQARHCDVNIHHMNGTISIQRAQLSTAEILRWEARLGVDMWRQSSRHEEYVPGQDI